ncbi:MAG: response regulator transcription factor [Dehalococcoidia bacterium]|nr:response regulator transcription factor [Dehalococcoidia bacterium]
MTRIVLADDHIMFRQAIARALDDVEGFQVVGQASTAEEAIELVTQLAPEVVLMDITMPGMGGLMATEAVRKAYPGVGVLIVTIHDREDYFFKALQAGASGYILKGAELDELVEAVQAVAMGKTYISPSLIPKLLQDYLHRRQGSGMAAGEVTPLSPREQEVLSLIAAGSTTAEIAQALTLSPHTVRRHRDHIMEKLDLHSKAELIRFAIRKGLLEEPG